MNARWLRAKSNAWFRKYRYLYAGLLRIYTLLLMLPVTFSGFWILLLAYGQGTDRNKETIKVFPDGFNDLTAIIPASLAAMAALFFSAQQSTNNRQRSASFGIAGRRMALSAIYMFSSFILMIGSRIMDGETFNGWRFEEILNQAASNMAAFMYINGLIAGFLLLVGIYRFVQATLSDKG